VRVFDEPPAADHDRVDAAVCLLTILRGGRMFEDISAIFIAVSGAIGVGFALIVRTLADLVAARDNLRKLREREAKREEARLIQIANPDEVKRYGRAIPTRDAEEPSSERKEPYGPLIEIDSYGRPVNRLPRRAGKRWARLLKGLLKGLVFGVFAGQLANLLFHGAPKGALDSLLKQVLP
jgi:hypothetical protein